MDTRFLETFLYVVDHGSIAAAARILNITPAAVSQRIRALEDELGYSLIFRTGRTVSPTESGMAIIDRARQFVLQLKTLKTPPDTLPLAGELRIGAIATAMTGLLPQTISRVSKKFDGIEMRARPGTSTSLYAQVLSQKLDAAIVVIPPFELPKSCGWKTFYREELVLMKPVTVSGVDIAEVIRTNPFVQYDATSWGGRLADTYLQQHNITPQVRFEMDALEAIAILVDRGFGVSLVPRWPEPWPSGVDVDCLPVGDPEYDRIIGLVWNRGSPRLRLIEATINEVMSLLDARKR